MSTNTPPPSKKYEKATITAHKKGKYIHGKIGGVPFTTTSADPGFKEHQRFIEQNPDYQRKIQPIKPQKSTQVKTAVSDIAGNLFDKND